jgi:hypothetical protein
LYAMALRDLFDNNTAAMKSYQKLMAGRWQLMTLALMRDRKDPRWW